MIDFREEFQDPYILTQYKAIVDILNSDKP